MKGQRVTVYFTDEQFNQVFKFKDPLIKKGTYLKDLILKKLKIQENKKNEYKKK